MAFNGRWIKWKGSKEETGLVPYEDTIWKLTQWYKENPIQIKQLCSRDPVLLSRIEESCLT